MRLVVAFVACLALLAATVALARGDAAGIQYDEISRSIMPGATPPPPGAFQSDLALVHAGKIVSENTMMTRMPKVNPVAALVNFGSRLLTGGQLQHVAYFGAMARAENRATGHVLITDTGKSRRYDLDPAARSYRVLSWSGAQDAATPLDLPDGSASVIVDMRTTQGVGRRIEGIDTDLYEIVEDITVQSPTGQCKATHLRLDTLQYVARSVAAPAGSSTTFDQAIRSHPELATGSPHCSASIILHAQGATVPSDRLIVYSRTTMSMPEVQNKPMEFSMVTERGNVRPLTQAQAASLFTLPAGFRLAP